MKLISLHIKCAIFLVVDDTSSGDVLEAQCAIRRHHTYVFVTIGSASDDVYQEDRLFIHQISLSRHI